VSDFKPLHGRVKVRRVSRYVSDTDMCRSRQWLGTHIRYEGVCPEHREHTHHGRTDQTHIPIATPAQHFSPPDHRNPLRVGVYLIGFSGLSRWALCG
jgi:hypothetical protein